MCSCYDLVLTCQYVVCRFAYPAAAVVSTFYLLSWQTLKVGRARKQAKIDYPQGKSAGTKKGTSTHLLVSVRGEGGGCVQQECVHLQLHTTYVEHYIKKRGRRS